MDEKWEVTESLILNVLITVSTLDTSLWHCMLDNLEAGTSSEDSYNQSLDGSTRISGPLLDKEEVNKLASSSAGREPGALNRR